MDGRPEAQTDFRPNRPFQLQSIANATDQYPPLVDSLKSILDVIAIVIGTLGLSANIVILYILVASKQRKKHVHNILFLGQFSADLYSCALLIVTRLTLMFPLPYEGPIGRWICKTVTTEVFLWIGISSSALNIGAITIERYIMIVFPIWHKKHFRRWMIYMALVIIWMSSVSICLFASIPSSDVIDGNCLVYSQWENYTVGVTSIFIIVFVTCFGLVILFVYCYGHILFTIRRQSRRLEGRYGPESAQAKATREKARLREMNTVKTMLTITTLFTICFCPTNILYVITTFHPRLFNRTLYNLSVFLVFVNISCNPFIYAAKYDVIREGLCRILRRIRRGQANASTTIELSTGS